MQISPVIFAVRAGSLTSIATIVAATIGSMACTAQASPETPRVVVQFGDLNLAKPEGVRVLYQRIQNAAVQVCISHDGKSLEQRSSFDSRKRAAIDKAVAQIAVPELTAYHVVKTGAAHKPERYVAKLL